MTAAATAQTGGPRSLTAGHRSVRTLTARPRPPLAPSRRRASVVGIEAGAGLTRITQEAVIPTYGLESMEYLVSSSPAMLAELDSALASGEDIAVTLWRPHWACQEYDLKNLEDPEGALGDAEEVHTIATAGFSEEHPDTAHEAEYPPPDCPKGFEPAPVRTPRVI
ncbi:glycine betaine ABC transporter substrate-binding protein [Georgenia sp. EYE_87]|uniref:glycine betaine ABC transporter substrate-binding protein n=1 Tax=Georgenia sp. EYE_87 TaxID=2853448 RepID=UPI00200391B2|nr:glycine betaine ABC transporter substrate-binding protein [Georgenia sp. EYE_87]